MIHVYTKVYCVYLVRLELVSDSCLHKGLLRIPGPSGACM